MQYIIMLLIVIGLAIAEYQEYLKELSIIDIQQQRADIDYIMLMTGTAED